jgi:hypothetical protein
VTPFRFEHEFRAPAPAAIFEAYFDPALSEEHDRQVEIARREVLELDDGPAELRRVTRAVPRRQLPAVIRPFVPGELSYVERLVWRKADDAIDLRVEPSILGGRTEIVMRYTVAPVGDGVVRRTCEGHVSVELRLIGRRVERTIVEDLGRSLATAAACTQAWLDRRILEG